MRLFRIQEHANAESAFDRIPEAAMGIHVAQTLATSRNGDHQIGPDRYALIIDGMLAVLLTDLVGDELAVNETLLQEPWLNPRSAHAEKDAPQWAKFARARFDTWYNRLPQIDIEPLRKPPRDPDKLNAPEILAIVRQQRAVALQFILQAGPFPTGPTGVPNHVPFQAITTPGDVFYRFESRPPPSGKIIRGSASSGRLLPGTFACPQSELPFMPTGFAVVARCALPHVTPACYRWELQPDHSQMFYCGAAVPQFGQSGGGVEVLFVMGANHSAPIPDPVVIPEL